MPLDFNFPASLPTYEWTDGKRRLGVEPLTLFETDFSVDGTGLVNISGTNYSLITNSPPPGGTHSARFNVKNGQVDPITSITGSNINTANFTPGIDPDLYGQVTWVLPFRLDDFTWGGAAGDELNAKLVYMGGKGFDSQDGFYLSGNAMGGATGSLNLGDNSGGDWDGWINESYGWRTSGGSPTTAIYGTTGQPWGTDGQWHELRVMFDYNNGGAGYSRIKVLLDGYVLNFTNGNSTDGWANLPPSYRCDRMRLFYADPTTAGTSVDGTGYACGLQWGDLKLYSGLKES